jgi:protein-S-isoprenylcysteine O-methyltransferase Ste14
MSRHGPLLALLKEPSCRILPAAGQAVQDEATEALMSMQDWIRNTRGEWYVLAQGVLVLSVLLAPTLDGTSPSLATTTTVVGSILCVIGLALAAFGARSLGPGVSPFPRPRDGAHLVETGVYAIVRHPIYSGLTLFALGYSLIWMSVAALVSTAALFVLLDMKSRREERWLQLKFDSYGRYQARVRRLIPFVY